MSLSMIIQEEMLFKLAVAMFLGLLLGLEREIQKKPLGLRTAMVISLASCLLTIVSIESAYTFPDEIGAAIRMDPLRLAAQIVSGIGFLGAGVIMVQGGITITGLTTAAIIWAASGLGIAVGAGFWKEATVTAVLLLIGIELIPRLIKLVGPGNLKEKEVIATLVVNNEVDVDVIHEEIDSKDFNIKKLKISDLKHDEIRLEYVLYTKKNENNTAIYNELKEIKGIVKVDIESI